MTSTPVPSPGDSAAHPTLLHLLELDDLGSDRYGASSWPGPASYMYGGQVVAQALRAASLTVDARHAPQSLHGYFVAAGDSTVPIEISVERLRDGRSFATRRVVTRQRNKTIFTLEASFHVDEDGAGDYQRPMTAGLPGPDEDGQWTRPMGPTYFSELFETREFAPQGKDQAGVFGSTRRFWARTRDRLPDDPALHAVVLAYLSDYAAVLGADVSPRANPSARMITSLDHCLWFHRPGRLDDWTLIDYHPVSSSGARGLIVGHVYTLDGTLIATATQEVLIRATA